ncbi:MAG TPA: beta-N-acetylhexosaminidase [Tepidisphaeraceae bacterium]|jgi:hypothetical protein|nr:beta-N-acetylhexosaminidase [Tepidisphaeraceae bacterium]
MKSLLIALILCLCLPTFAALELLPQPQSIQLTPNQTFDPSTIKSISVSNTPEDRFAARLLRDSIRQTQGIDPDILLLPPSPHQLYTSLPTTPSSDPHPESYTLSVTPANISLMSPSDAGLFYATQTLIQLLEQSQRDHTPLPALTITDHPTFDWRGRYFDASQYTHSIVTTRTNLEHEIKTLARYKLNCLCFDAYNFVPFASFPACTDSTTLSRADWDYLVELAHQYHVTLIPSLQSFAQMYQVIWTTDAGKPYRESTAGGLICPSRPENIAFLQGLYKDLLTVFKYSPILGIGCSEVGMAWGGHYCPLCQARIDNGETLHDIYYKHVTNCVNAVTAAAAELHRTVRPMIWADEFYLGYNNQRWVDIDRIPKNTLMGHWQYWSRYQGLAVQTNKTYDGISGLLSRGFDVFTVSASFEYNTYFHDLSPTTPLEGKPELLQDSGIINIADQARYSAEYNQQKFPAKVWGGVCATFSQHDIRCWDTTWFAYALQSEYTWGDPSRPLNDLLPQFTTNFTSTFYQPTDRPTADLLSSAYHDLDDAKSDIERNNYLIRDLIGEYDIHDPAYIDNTLEASLKLISTLPPATLTQIRTRAQHIIEVASTYRQKLSAALPKVQNPTSLHYLITAAHKLENHAQRTIFLLDLSQTLQNPKTNSPNDLLTRCTSLQNDTQLISDEMDLLTQTPNGSGYTKVLTSLNTFHNQLNDLAKNDVHQN